VARPDGEAPQWRSGRRPQRIRYTDRTDSRPKGESCTRAVPDVGSTSPAYRRRHGCRRHRGALGCALHHRALDCFLNVTSTSARPAPSARALTCAAAAHDLSRKCHQAFRRRTVWIALQRSRLRQQPTVQLRKGTTAPPPMPVEDPRRDAAPAPRRSAVELLRPDRLAPLPRSSAPASRSSTVSAGGPPQRGDPRRRRPGQPRPRPAKVGEIVQPQPARDDRATSVTREDREASATAGSIRRPVHCYARAG